MHLYFRSRSPLETRDLARRLAAGIGEQGLVIALVGPMGAGKTVFASGLAEGLGIDPRRVTSPSFVIAAHHEGPGCDLVHVDLYRLEDPGELEASGWLDWLAPGNVVVVEWADRFDVLPPDHLEVRIARPGGSEAAASEVAAEAEVAVREIALRANGPRARQALAGMGAEPCAVGSGS